jgi:hypothetical protein
MIGGGFDNFTEFCAFPAYCAKCDRLVTVNMFDTHRHCPKRHRIESIPLNDKTLIGELGENVVASWNYDGEQLELTDGHYFCPACHQFTLTFEDGGVLWD